MIGTDATALVPVLLTERGQTLAAWHAVITKHVAWRFASRAYHNRWARTERGRAHAKRYRQSEQGKITRRRWARARYRTTRGRYLYKSWRTSAQGREARARYFTRYAHKDSQVRSYINWITGSVERSEALPAEWTEWGSELAIEQEGPALTPSAGLAAQLILGARDDVLGLSTPRANAADVWRAIYWLRGAEAPLTVEQCCDLLRLPYSDFRRWCDTEIIPYHKAPPAEPVPVALNAVYAMFQAGGPL